jgi:hypothetical protein
MTYPLIGPPMISSALGRLQLDFRDGTLLARIRRMVSNVSFRRDRVSGPIAARFGDSRRASIIRQGANDDAITE